MRCPNCASQVEDNPNYCPFCGCKLEGEIYRGEPLVSRENQAPNQNFYQTQNQVSAPSAALIDLNDKRQRFLILMILICLFILGGLVTNLFSRKSRSLVADVKTESSVAENEGKKKVDKVASGEDEEAGAAVTNSETAMNSETDTNSEASKEMTAVNEAPMEEPIGLKVTQGTATTETSKKETAGKDTGKTESADQTGKKNTATVTSEATAKGTEETSKTGSTKSSATTASKKNVLSEEEETFARTLLCALEHVEFDCPEDCEKAELAAELLEVPDIEYVFFNTETFLPYTLAEYDSDVIRYRMVEENVFAEAYEAVFDVEYDREEILDSLNDYGSYLYRDDQIGGCEYNGRGGYGEVVVNKIKYENEKIIIHYSLLLYETAEDSAERIPSVTEDWIAGFKKNEKNEDYPLCILYNHYEEEDGEEFCIDTEKETSLQEHGDLD